MISFSNKTQIRSLLSIVFPGKEDIDRQLQNPNQEPLVSIICHLNRGNFSSNTQIRSHIHSFFLSKFEKIMKLSSETQIRSLMSTIKMTALFVPGMTDQLMFTSILIE